MILYSVSYQMEYVSDLYHAGCQDAKTLPTVSIPFHSAPPGHLSPVCFFSDFCDLTQGYDSMRAGTKLCEGV